MGPDRAHRGNPHPVDGHGAAVPFPHQPWAQVTASSGPDRPVIAILAPHWESRTEEGWIARQMAGALAGSADIHVLSPDGADSTSTDSVFTVHHLADRLDPSAELRRDLIVASLSEITAVRDLVVDRELAAVVDRHLIDPWRGATQVLAALDPESAVIVGYNNLGALDAVDAYRPDVPVSLMAMGGDTRALAFPHFDRLFDRAGSVLAVTEAERAGLVEAHGDSDRIHRVGAPMAANPNVLTEPDALLGASDYILVVTEVGMKDDHQDAELSRLVQMRFADNPVGICYNDAFCAWDRGRLTKGWPIERSSDLARLMAWARVTVDLRPGRLFARRCIESLLYGTPIVVPHDSRARQHAERGRGGLWFADPAELTWCVEGLLAPAARDALGAQGRAYAEAEYGSTDRFIHRVLDACGLAPAATTAPVTG
jgi:hypothetical protein